MDVPENSEPSSRGDLAGRVRTRQGKAIAGAVVMITGESPSHKDIAALTDQHGQYRFVELIPGEYSILVNTEEYGLQTLQTRVRAGQTARLDFTLEG
jgi:hypothetical protein